VLLLGLMVVGPIQLPAQVIRSIGAGAILVAHEEEISRYERDGLLSWSSAGPRHPREIALSDDRRFAAVADPIERTLWIVALADGAAKRVAASISPRELLFDGEELLLLSRETSAVLRLNRNGEVLATAQVGLEPSFLRITRGKLHVYSRIEGRLSELDPRTLTLLRSIELAPFAASMQAGGNDLWLAYPRAGRVVVVDLETFRPSAEMSVGAVPLDVAAGPEASVISAGEMMIADPSSKRIWRQERRQSVAAATGRGFLRGLIGLGLHMPRASEFPTGVDRLRMVAGRTYAYDTSTGTLYRAEKKGAVRLLEKIAWSAFDIDESGNVAFWSDQFKRPQWLAPVN
jgi:hypothetical protein